ncbi:MAG TPA: 2'-5' RNA ligase family protein [Burkholderiaceae bacterium]
MARLRERFDPSAALGMPAHITLLYPFMPPELMGAAVLQQVRAAVAGTCGFAFSLARVDRFPGVLYLAPEPASPFIELTRLLAHEFPEFPPYGGRYEAIVPHLTVAQAGGAEQSHAEAELLSSLSGSAGIACSCSELVLMENAAGRWEPMHVFPLAPRH